MLSDLPEWQTDDRAMSNKQQAWPWLSGVTDGRSLLKDDKQANILSAEQCLQARVGLGIEHAKQLRPALEKAIHNLPVVCCWRFTIYCLTYPAQAFD